MLPDSVFDEKYEILGQLGEGGLGTVYRAKQIDFGRIVALKVLHNQFAVDDDFKTRFLREAKVLNQLKHPNIVQIFHLGVAATGQPYLAMELVEGKNCRKLLNEQDRLPTLIALKIVHDAALALSYVHENGIVHRDLKPENILVLNEPEPNTVKLIDFGLVRLLDSNEKNQKLTQTGDLLGTAAYMSPEQCKGQKADSRADIYSLGACLFELLTGEKCYTADSDVGLLYKHATEAPPAVKASMVETFSPSLDKLISKAMQKEPEMRFQTMKEMADAIESAILEIEKRGAKNKQFAFGGTMPVKIIAAIILVGLVLFAFKTYHKAQDESGSQQVSAKQKELISAETVHLPLRSADLHELVYKYNKAQGLEAGLTITKRWLKAHERHAPFEDTFAVYTLLVRLLADLHQDKEMEYYANKVFANPEAHLQSILVAQTMANCYEKEQQPAKAIAIIEKTLNSRPAFKQYPPISLINIEASILVDLGEYDKAIKMLTTIEKNGGELDAYGEFDSPAWRLTLIRAYSKSNQESKLKKLTSETVNLVKAQQGDSALPLARLYLEIAKRLADPNSDNEDALYYAKLATPLLLQAKAYSEANLAEEIIGSTLQRQGKYTEALKLYRRIAERPPESIGSMVINIIHMYECAKWSADWSMADTYIQRAMQILSDEYKTSNAASFRNDSNLYWIGISSLTNTYLDKGEFAKAEQLLNQWMDNARKEKIAAQIYVDLSFRKFEVLFKEKRYAEALKCTDSTLKLLNTPSFRQSLSQENLSIDILRTHMWKSMALSFLKDKEASLKETSWIAQNIKANQQMSLQAKAATFLSLANVFNACGQTTQAGICCDEAETSFLNKGSTLNREELESYVQIAEFKASQFQNSAAESIFRTCISRLNAIGLKQSQLMLRCKLSLGDLLKRQAKYKEAKEVTTEALSLAKQLNLNTHLYYLCHRVLYEIYYNNEDYLKAREIAALNIDAAPADYITMAYCDEANALRKLKNFAEAEKLIIKAIESAKKTGRSQGEINSKQAFAENAYAHLYLDQHMYQKALEHADKAITLSEQAGDYCRFSYLAEAFHEKGSALTKMNKKAEAIPCLTKARELFDSLGHTCTKEKEDIAVLMGMCSKTEPLPSH